MAGPDAARAFGHNHAITSPVDARERRRCFEELRVRLEREHAALREEAAHVAKIGDSAALRSHTLRLQQHLADVKTYVAAVQWFERQADVRPSLDEAPSRVERTG